MFTTSDDLGGDGDRGECILGGRDTVERRADLAVGGELRVAELNT